MKRVRPEILSNFFIISITADEKVVFLTRGTLIKFENYVLIGFGGFAKQKKDLG